MVPPDSDRAPPTPPYSGYRLGWLGLRVRGCHPLPRALPGVFRCPRLSLNAGPTTPGAPRRPGFGLAPFRSPLLGGSLLFSFPPPTWMFRFGGFAPTTGGCRALARRVAPFGHPRILGCSRLPAAFRGLPRPSSPPGATGIPRAPSLACLAARPGSPRAGRARLSCFCFSPANARLSANARASSHPVKEPPPLPAAGRGECGARTHDPRLAKPVL